MENAIQLSRQRTVIRIRQHQIAHIYPPAFADFSLGDLLPALFLFDLGVGEQSIGRVIAND